MAFHRGPYVVKDGLVLWLDAANTKSYVSGSTTWRDLSGNNNTVTLTNGPTFSNTNGGSITFDGSNDYAVYSGSFSNLPSSTLSAFVWVKSNLTNYYILSQGRSTTNVEGEYILEVVNSKLIFWDYRTGYGFSNSNAGSNISIITNQWYQVGFIKNSTSGTYYINGISAGIISAGKDVAYTNTPFYIASNFRDNTGYLNGNISNLQIYNRALSALEVQQNFNALRGRYGI
jgi:hypothetical protein